MTLRFCLRAIKSKLAVACIKYIVLLLYIIRTSFITLIIANFFCLGIGHQTNLSRDLPRRIIL